MNSYIVDIYQIKAIMTVGAVAMAPSSIHSQFSLLSTIVYLYSCPSEINGIYYRKV